MSEYIIDCLTQFRYLLEFTSKTLFITVIIMLVASSILEPTKEFSDLLRYFSIVSISCAIVIVLFPMENTFYILLGKIGVI